MAAGDVTHLGPFTVSDKAGIKAALETANVLSTWSITVVKEGNQQVYYTVIEAA